MRQVVLDTETTGLSWDKGNRVVMWPKELRTGKMIMPPWIKQ